MHAPRNLTVLTGVLASLGILVAGYLTVSHYSGGATVCAVVHGCEVVQKSDWSKLAGIPVAVLGLAGYLAILGSLFVRGEAGLMAGALFSVGGFGFSMYLTYREAFTIDAWCMWCVISAILMTLLAITTVLRVWKAEPAAAAGHEADEPAERAAEHRHTSLA